MFPKIDLNVRSIDAGITLRDVDSLRDYLNVNGIDIAYQNMPLELRRIGPTKAPLYTRTYSVTFLEPEPEKKTKKKAGENTNNNDEAEILTRYESSIATIRRFEEHVESLEGKKRQCAEAFRETYEHNGRRLADNIRNVNEDIKSVEGERERMVRLATDIVLFRTPFTLGTYGIFEGPLGNIDIDLPGLPPMKGRDVAEILAPVTFGVASLGSYFWSRKKINDFRKRLRGSIEMVYRQAILESVDDLYMHYPDSIVQLMPQAGEMLAEIRGAKERTGKKGSKSYHVA